MILSITIGRNGVQPTAQNAWGDWCNLIGTGFGVRPTTNTGDALEDAFVWIKPGGECDVCLFIHSSSSRQLTYLPRVLRTQPQPAMTITAVWRMHFNLLQRQVLGSKPTLLSYSPMPTLAFKVRENDDKGVSGLYYIHSLYNAWKQETAQFIVVLYILLFSSKFVHKTPTSLRLYI